MDHNHDDKTQGDHGHDHNATTHSMNCPVEGCTFNMEVHAHDDDEAVQKIMMSGKAHFEDAHPDAPAMNPDEMVAATKAGMVTH
jgi:hypothetical protein